MYTIVHDVKIEYRHLFTAVLYHSFVGSPRPFEAEAEAETCFQSWRRSQNLHESDHANRCPRIADRTSLVTANLNSLQRSVTFEDNW